MTNGLFSVLSRLIGVAILLSTILVAVRFGLAQVGVCQLEGSGRATRVQCLGVVEFRGSDLMSIYRIRLIN